MGCWGTAMRAEDDDFDLDRYRQVRAEAVDETKRLALIDLLIEERAMQRLQAQLASAGTDRSNNSRDASLF